MSDFAPGLPNKVEYGDFSKLKPGTFVDFIVQRHEAERAGSHLDVRFGDSATGLFSWATKKNLPGPGGKISLFQQPLHRYEYKNFEGEISSGYGKGKVKKHEEGKLLLTKITDKTIHFTKTHKKYPERFVLVRPKGDNKQWLLVNTTPTKPIPYKKLHYSKVSPDKAEEVLKDLQPGSSVQAKVDGAASLVKLFSDRLEIASYRTAKESGHPIIHTERVFQGPSTVSIPKKYVGSVLRGELYGEKAGKSIPPQELGGLLNSSVSKSVADQRSRGVKLKNLIFDIQQEGEEPTIHLPYAKRLELVKEITKLLPKKHFHPPDEAKTSKEAIKLYRDIKAGKSPLTSEGIVIHHTHGKPTKVKFTEEHDVHITGFFPGEGRLKDKAVGGFTYSLKPGGKTVGKVGTGFSDELRKEMHKNPYDFLGRVAKVVAQNKLPSGALRAPALKAIHEDYPAAKVAQALPYFFK